MEIKVIGSGCNKCQALYEMIKNLQKEGKITQEAKIEYSKDMNELAEQGVMGSPAIIVDGEVLKVGMPNGKEELLELLPKE